MSFINRKPVGPTARALFSYDARLFIVSRAPTMTDN